ncbi:42506_t:CDS:1 [Gigaspora margarita]|uniref:42506_t:CDS:1 n=1 Tax=Gigaspora margarita TaxID=4874 RepID=A0ABN7UN26_GIGMA|nr:42506_t:CDS:1 [Gigaspora margarita]
MYDGKFLLNVESSDTIDSIKSKILSILGIQDDLSLIFAGKLLKDKQTHSDYNIQNRFIIYSCIALSIIFIKVPAGKTFNLGARPFDTIGCIKLEIQTLKEIPVSKQQLIFNGKLLENEWTLSDYDIEDNSMLHLIFSEDITQSLSSFSYKSDYHKDAY